jgi:hypothetical protein
MAASPWLFGFAKKGTRYWLPHVLMGVADVLAAVTSKTEYSGVSGRVKVGKHKRARVHLEDLRS